MKLKPTEKNFKYTIGDESGYRFNITATFDEEIGWNATLEMKSFGLNTAENAVVFLGKSARDFVRQLERLELEDE